MPKLNLFALVAACLVGGPAFGAIRFEPPVYYPHDPPNASPVLADIDGDGDLDMVLPKANFGVGPWWSRLGNGDGTFGALVPFEVDALVNGVCAGDLDGDGRADVVSVSSRPDLRVHLSRGDGTFAETLYPITPIGVDVALSDLDGDGDLDVLVGHNERSIAVFLGNGDGTLHRVADVEGTVEGALLAVADYSGDGILDVVFGTLGGFPQYAYSRGRGDGTFDRRVLFPKFHSLEATDALVRAGDLNNDGFLDLVVGHLTGLDDDYLGVLLATGTATWGPERIEPTSGGSVPSLVLADFDQDGNLDLVFFDLDRTVKLRRGNGDGTFSDDFLVWETGLFTDFHMISAGDLDGDGWTDIVFEDYDGNDPPRTVVLLNRSASSSPVADAGPDQAAECDSPAGASVTLDGSGSSDADSTPSQDDIVSYEWFTGYGSPSQTLIATGRIAVVDLPFGEHEVTLVVTDTGGATGTDSTLVSVRDTVAPLLEVKAAPEYLWPPNHKMVAVQLTIDSGDACDPVPAVRLVAAVSSEPDDAPGGGDGHTKDDMQGAGLGTPDTEVLLRAERQGRDGIRIYTLSYEAQDAAANVAAFDVEVRVAKPPRPASSAGSLPSSGVRPKGAAGRAR